MRQTVTVSRSKKGWFPAIGELVHYKSANGGTHRVAMRVDVPRKDNNKVRFAFIDNGVLGNTVSGSQSAISKAIEKGRVRPYEGTASITQTA